MARRRSFFGSGSEASKMVENEKDRDGFVGKKEEEKEDVQVDVIQEEPLLGGWGGLDLRSIALLRVSIATIVLVDLALRIPFLRELHCDDYLLPAGYNQHGWIVHRILFYRGGVLLQSIIAAIQALVLLSYVIGYRTKVTSVLSWLMTVMMHSRNDWANDAGEKLTVALLFWLMFLPSDWCFAYNRTFNGRKKARFTSFSTIAYRLQILFLYLFPMYLRWSSPLADTWTWSKATAVYYSMHYSTGTNFGMNVIGRYPGLCRLLTRTTIVLETAGSILLVFSPVERINLILVVCFFLLHMGIAATVNIGVFPFVSALSAVGFLPAQFWQSKLVLRMFQSTPVSLLSKLAILLGKAFEACFGANRNRQKMSGIQPAGARILGGFFMVYLIYINLGNLDLIPKPDEGNIAEGLRFIQRWIMYSPNAPYHANWFVVEGKLEGGVYVDLMEVWRRGWKKSRHDWITTGWRPSMITFDRPRPSPHVIYPSVRIQHFMVLRMFPRDKPKESELLSEQFVRYLCRQWKQHMRAPPAKVPRLLEVTVYRATQKTMDPDSDPPSTYGGVMAKHHFSGIWACQSLGHF